MIPIAAPMAIRIGVIALAAGAIHATAKRHPLYGKLTEERKIVLEVALDTLKDPSKLNELAGAYERNGLPDQGALLRKRAKLRTLPKALKDARSEAFRKGMGSTNAEGIRKLAQAFHNEGATGAAAALEERAKGVTGVHAVIQQPAAA